MSCVHYKFKSSLDYQTVTFDGLHISLGDLKKAISQHKKLKPGEYNLEITNAQTREVYVNNSELIPRNSSVIVSRIPIQTNTSNSTSKAWEAFKQECAKAIQQEKEMMTLEDLKKTADLTSAKASEMDKIKAMIDQSTKDFDPSNYKTKSLPTGPPPATYRCYRCNQTGHYIHNCPSPKLKVKTTDEDGTVHELEPKFKRSTGIPNSFLTYVNNPLLPGALLTHSGQFAVPTLDAEAYIRGKKEKPPFLPSSENDSVVSKKPQIPKELMCPICEDLLRDAVITPCCGNSFCDECIRNALVESDEHECPQCHETDVSPNQLTQNKFHRMAVTNFLNESSMLNEQKEESPPPPPPPYPPPKDVGKPSSVSPAPSSVNTPVTQVHSSRSVSESVSAQSAENHSYTSHHQPSNKSYSHSDRSHHHGDRGSYHQSERPFQSRHNHPRQPQLTVVPIQGAEDSPSADDGMVRDIQPSTTEVMADGQGHSTIPSHFGRSIGLSSDSDDLHPPGTENIIKKPTIIQEDDILEKWREYEKKYEKKSTMPPATVIPTVPPVPAAPVAPIRVVPPPQAFPPAAPPVVSVPPVSVLPPPPGYMGPPPGPVPVPVPVPIPNAVPPVAPAPGFPGPPFVAGPHHIPYAPPAFPSVPKPLTKQEFYREQDRLRKQESEIRKRDFMDDFEQELREKKTKKIPPVIKPRSRSRSYSRSLSKSPGLRSRSKTRSRTRTRSRSRGYSRSRSRSYSRGPPRRRSRSSRLRTRSRSLTRSPRHRSRTRSRSRLRSYSRSRSRSRSRIRSRMRSRSWTRSRSHSYSPLPRKFSRSRSRSWTRSPRRKSPVPFGRHSRSPVPPNRFRPRGSKGRGFNRDRSPYTVYHSPARNYSPEPYQPDPYYPGMRMYPGYGGEKWGYHPPVPPGVAPGIPPPFDSYIPNPGPGYNRSRSKSPWKFGSLPPDDANNWPRPEGREMIKDHFTERHGMGDGWDRWNSGDRRSHDITDRRERGGRKDYSNRKENYERKDAYSKKYIAKRSVDKIKEGSEKNKQPKDKIDIKRKNEKEVKENIDQDQKQDIKMNKDLGKKALEKADDEKKKGKLLKDPKTKEDKVVRTKNEDRDETRNKIVKTDPKRKVIKAAKPSQDIVKTDSTEVVSQNRRKNPDIKTEKNLQIKPKTVVLKSKNRVDASDGSQSDNMPGKLKVKRVKKKRLRSVAENAVVDAKFDQIDTAPEFDLRQRLKKRTLSQSQEGSDDSSPSKRKKAENLSSEQRGSQIQVLSRMKPLPIKLSGSLDDDDDDDDDDVVMPELSKWERDDYDEDEIKNSPKTVTDKKPLPRSVIESAEKVLSQKQMKPSSIASAVAPVRSRPFPASPERPHRRVYLENLKTADNDDRRVSSKQKSIEVTISSDKVEGRSKHDGQTRTVSKVISEKDENERTARYSDSKRSSRSDESKISVSKLKDDSEKDRINEFRDYKEGKDKAKVDNQEQGQGHSSKNDRSSQERNSISEVIIEKKSLQDEKECSSSSHRKYSDSEGSSKKQKSAISSEQESTNKSQNSNWSRSAQVGDNSEVQKLSSQSDNSVSATKLPAKSQNEDGEKSQQPLERKESIIDEATFEPDYEESADSESDGDAAFQSATDAGHQTHTTSSASHSPSASSDDDTSPSKKQRTDDEKHKSKKSKHKKHKHKNKHKHKGKHKHKKHKKTKIGKPEEEGKTKLDKS